jgi:hypothetical protein
MIRCINCRPSTISTHGNGTTARPLGLCSRCPGTAGECQDRNGYQLCDLCAAVVLPDEVNHPRPSTAK